MAESKETKDIVETTLEEAIKKWEKKKAYWKELSQMNGLKEELELRKKYLQDIGNEPNPAKRLKIIDKYEKDSKIVEAKVKKEMQFEKVYKELDRATNNLLELNYHLDQYLYNKRLKALIYERNQSKPGS